MSLRAKLLWAQTPLALALLLAALLFLRTMGALGVASQSILKDNFRSVLAMQHLKDVLEEGRDTGGARGPSLAPTEHELELQESNITEAGEGAATARLRTAWDAYRAGDVGKRRAVREAADEVLALNLDAIVRKNDGVRGVISRNETAVFFTTLLAALLGILASGALTARLLRPLGVLGQTVRRVGEGDLDARISLEGHDEIATLAREFNAMTAKMKRYRESSLGELLEAQAASQASLDSLPDPVLVFDARSALVNVNAAAERMLQVSVDTGSAALAALDAHLLAALERSRAFVLAGRGAYVPRGFEEATSVFTPEGQRYLLARASPVHSASAGIAGVSVVFQDVTRVRLFDELQNDVVATVAHEFRTPLTSLRMAVHLCLEEAVGPLTSKQADLLHAAREDTERLQTMVDDLLDVARIQSGSAGGLKIRTISAAALVADAVASHRESAREKGLELRAAPAPEGLLLAVDVERLALVFNNLLQNALQHTPPGGVLEVRTRAESNRAHFEVSDDGPGIPAEFQERLFDKFFQVPGVTGGAAGLGLHICKEVIRAHGGEIGVRSELGRGTTFWFELPRAAPPRV